MTFGPLIIDIEGPSLSQEDRELLHHPAIGGLILFARNIQSSNQVEDLVADIRSEVPSLLITVDQEGGRVQRLQSGFSKLPPLRTIGERFDTDPEGALALATQLGWLMASEVLAVGIDLSFAPVCDCDRISQVIGNRAFHSDPDIVSQLAIAYQMGMKEAGMAATAKHFPGHGSVELDSHLALPTDLRALPEIMADDMRVFKAMIGANVDAIMPAHIVFPAIDAMPVGFSSIWLQDILRTQLKFSGVIISDDLMMKATDPFGNITTRTQKALDAGCDLILICNDREAVSSVLSSLSHWESKESAIQRLRGRFHGSFTQLHSSSRWQTVQAELTD